jgi:hypothetical protein
MYMSNKGKNHIHLPYTLSFQYKPTRPPVTWAESLEDVPPWDWTRGTPPDRTWFDTPENVAMRSWWLYAEPAKGDLFFPRLVRLHAAHMKQEPFKGHVYREFVKLWKLAENDDLGKGSKFREAVVTSVQKIGLADLRTDTPQLWFYTALECHLWLTVLLKLEEESYPLADDVWDDLKESFGLRCVVVEPRLKNDNFVGLTHDLLEFGGSKGEAVRVTPYHWLKLNPEHETVQKALELGIISDKVPWVNDDSSPKDHFVYGLISKARFLTRDSKSSLKARQKVATGYFLPQFSLALSGNVQLDYNDQTEGFKAHVGARDWAFFELSNLYKVAGFRVCKNERCPYGKVFLPKHKREAYCCPACAHNTRMRRLRNK